MSIKNIHTDNTSGQTNTTNEHTNRQTRTSTGETGTMGGHKSTKISTAGLESTTNNQKSYK